MVRLRDEERGATLAIVAISLLALMGMLVLTFDLGRGVALKRNMVNGADAGALAAARECALGHGEVSAMGAADELLTLNNDSAEVTGFELAPGAQCGPGSVPDPNGKNEVTVTVSVVQEYFVAQIFGFDEGTVVANATAEWTYGVANPAPLKLEALKVEECLKGGAGSSCYVGFSGENGQWGWLNFPQGWPAEGEANPPTGCTSQGGTKELEKYIGQMGTEPAAGAFLPSLWNIPVWVCGKAGAITAAQSEVQKWTNTVGAADPTPVVNFPVVAPEFPPCPAEGCWPKGPGGSYPVIRFQGFELTELWKGPDIKKDPGLQEDCGFEGKNFPASVFCIELTVAGDDSGNPNSNPIVRLID